MARAAGGDVKRGCAGTEKGRRRRLSTRVAGTKAGLGLGGSGNENNGNIINNANSSSEKGDVAIANSVAPGGPSRSKGPWLDLCPAADCVGAGLPQTQRGGGGEQQR